MTQQPPFPESSRPSIVIVDDEQIVALDIRRTLERLGYAVPAMAADGEEAVRMAGELRPDLVLMDIRLRGPMDGIEAAGRIAGQYGVPVVFLTAFSDAATLERAKACGPFGFLVKPFEERELHSTIEVALLKHRAVRDLDEARRTAENASIAKSAFLAGMSHEIRNSLNGILGMTDLALESAEDEEQRDHLVTVLESAETLLALLNDVLDFFTAGGAADTPCGTPLRTRSRGAQGDAFRTVGSGAARPCPVVAGGAGDSPPCWRATRCG